MKNITYTLITDGTSDKVLMPIINWILDQIDDLSYVPQYAEYSLKPSAGLLKRAETAIGIYECDVLFVHRDAEAMPLNNRIQEISAQLRPLAKPFIPIVPIRMTEAWLLVEEKAIRSAANNPNGRTKLGLPGIRELENLQDPKDVLFEKLRQASDLPPRRIQKFKPEQCRHRVAELISDFAPLRKMSSFQQFENDLRVGIAALPN